MGFELAKGVIDDMQDCMGKEMLAFVHYPPAGTSSRCFTYPQYLVEGGRLKPIVANAFPDVGCLPASISSGETPSELARRFGGIAIVTLNQEPQSNIFYGGTEQNRYNGAINTSLSKGRSVVELAPFGKHALSSSLMQCIDIQESINLSRPITDPVHLYPGDELPVTKFVLIEQPSGGRTKYVGPFEARITGPDEFVITAVGLNFDSRVAALNADGFATKLELKDHRGAIAARFVSLDEFKGKFDSCDDMYDWISDEALVEVLGRISKLREASFSKSQVAALKSQIASCTELEAKLNLTPDRRKRMLKLVGAQAEWASLSDDMRVGAIDKADSEQLAEYVLSDEHFRGFYDKVIENSQIREQVEREKLRYRNEASKSQQEAAEAEERLKAVRAELSSFQGELDDKKRQVEQEMQQQLAGWREQEAALQAQVEKLAQEKSRLEQDNALVQYQIRKTVENMSDELSVSSKILESEMVRQIVLSLNAQPEAVDGIAAAPQPKKLEAPAVSVRQGAFSAQEVVEEVGRHINQVGGRDLDANDVVNLLTCLAQGYIVTLAGLPGTGKTSLANLLASSLGLKGDSRRFVEVPVERGWTSYKDFVGYYNPFTQTLEKANAAAFDAFERLDAEVAGGLGDGDVPPFLFLLDEANLSSIEHYWSPFLRACDSFRGGPSELALGGDKLLRVPGYVRFLATVNFDHTTEELSPRFLDRSWVITLEPDELDLEELDADGSAGAASQGAALSYAAVQDLFGPRKDALLEADLRAKLKEVLDACRAFNQPVSPRSRQMMVSYACTASKLMDRSSTSSAYAPVDYAVCQKVLPRLSGTEERLGDLLRRLSDIGGLPLTKARVEHMLRVGGDSGYFQYFA